jgi:hypothetical protein
MIPLLFADSNVLIEALLSSRSAACLVAEMVARGVFDLATCRLCVDDMEEAILAKLQNKPEELHETMASWERLKTDTRLIIISDPEPDAVAAVSNKYLGVMRHRADIPVLAAALAMDPQPCVILSGNRGHFNNAVANRCSIKICSCQEFIEFISEAP